MRSPAIIRAWLCDNPVRFIDVFVEESKLVSFGT